MAAPHPLVQAAEDAKARHAAELSALADEVLAAWLLGFAGRGRGSVHIRFGNGSELVEIDGRSIDREQWPARLGRAIEDVWAITDGYKLGCPNDVQWEAP